MSVEENIEILVNYLLGEDSGYSKLIIPSDMAGKGQLIRSLKKI